MEKTILKKPTKRRQILTEQEQQSYYERPFFDAEDCLTFFTLGSEEQSLLHGSPYCSAQYTLLQFGYFKAKHLFFDVMPKEVETDLRFIHQHYFPQATFACAFPSRNTRARIKQHITIKMGYETNKTIIKAYLIQQAAFLARQYNEPGVLFKELFLCLKQSKMLLPSYTTLQDIISQAYTIEENRLLTRLQEHLTPDVQHALDHLLGSSKAVQALHDLKKELTGFNYQAMKQEIEQHQKSDALYFFSKKCLPEFEIAEQTIQYYADHIQYYPPYQFKKFPLLKQYLYLLCYLHYRYEKMNDNVIHAFIYHVDKIKQSAGQHGSSFFLKQQKNLLFRDPLAIGLLIGNYANENLLASKKTFKSVAKKAHQHIPKETIREISEELMQQPHSPLIKEWQYYHEHRQYMEFNLRPLFKIIDFQADRMLHPLMEAIRFLKNVFEKGTPITQVPSDQFPKNIIPKKFKSLIIDPQGHVKPYHYEFFIYYKIRDYLVKNILYVNDSIVHKSIHEDLKMPWNTQAEKQAFLKQLNKPKLLVPIAEKIQSLEKEIEDLFVEVNENILSGKNTAVHVKTVKGKKTWTLRYPAPEKEFNHKFYEKLPIASISDVYDFVHNECDFTSEIKHFKTKHVKKGKDYQTLKACLIGEGTRQDLSHMASHSNIDLDDMRRTKQNYIREKSIRDMCKKVIKKMQKLPIMAYYKIGGKHWMSLDGSKKGTTKKISKARYSPKYFGLGRGFSSMGVLMDNMVVNSDIISCNEYEAHQLYELYFNHDASYDPDNISTDSHGSNKIKFLLFDLLDITLFICYKDIVEKTKYLAGFKEPEDYKEEWLIKPSKKSKTNLIIDYYDQIEETLIAILSKKTRQSILIKKLCHHGRKTALKEALWEYNQLFFTRSILTYINDPRIQKWVRMSLNRGEASNKFYNSLVKIGGKKFKGKSEIDIKIENQATRLLMLIISYYNMYILSAAIEQKKVENDLEAVELLSHVSPMAKQHLNLSGMYHFAEGAGINIAEIIASFTKALDNVCKKKKKQPSSDPQKKEPSETKQTASSESEPEPEIA